MTTNKTRDLEWRYFAGAFPAAWDAKTPFERYSIEERWGPNVEPPDWHQDVDSTWALTYGVQLVGVYKTLEAAKAAAQADYEQRILSALASVQAPSGAEPVGYISTYTMALLDSGKSANHSDISRTPGNKYVVPLYATPQAVAPTEIAGLVERIQAAREYFNTTDHHTTTKLLADVAAALTASEAEAAALRRKLEEAERERDAMVCGLSAVVHCQSSLTRSSMRNAAADILERVGRKPVDFGGDQSPFVARAKIAERKLEEARKALTDLINIIDLGWEAHNEDDSDKPIMANARATLRAIEGSAQ